MHKIRNSLTSNQKRSKIENFLGESCCGSEMAIYSSFLSSQLGNDVYIKSASLSSYADVDLVKSLTVHPFEQVRKASEIETEVKEIFAD